MNITELDVAEERAVYVGEDRQAAENYKAIWNVSQDKIGCIASKSYNIIQHREVVTSLSQAMQGLNMNYQMDMHQQGDRIFVDVNFPEAETIKLTQKGEEFATGLRLINSYDKSTGLVIVPRLTRLVCSNGMVMKKWGESLVMKHNSNFAKDVASHIEKALKNIINGHKNLQIMVDKAIGDSIEWMYVDKIMQNLIGRKGHMEEINNRLVAIAAGRTPNRWDLYNAITEYATHDEQLKPSVEAWLQTKAEKVLTTSSTELMPAVAEIEV